MIFDGAIVKEQGVEFVIIVVKRHVIGSLPTREKTIGAFELEFPGRPIILMAQDSKGTPEYYGRKDIVNYLANIDPRRIPWQKITIN